LCASRDRKWVSLGNDAFRSPANYWAIRLFCSTLTRLSVQNVQLGP